MIRNPTARVAHQILDMLFAELRVWERVKHGQLTSDVAPRKTVPSTNYPNALSQIVQHRLQDGTYVATTHRIINPVDGTIYHCDASDLHLNDVVLHRQGNA